jgi:hypothetical protein
VKHHSVCKTRAHHGRRHRACRHTTRHKAHHKAGKTKHTAVAPTAPVVTAPVAAPTASTTATPPPVFTTPFALPTYAPTSIWSAPVDGAQAIDPDSDGIVNHLLGMVNSEEVKHNGPWINTAAYSVPVYTVPASQPRVPVTLDVPWHYADSLRLALAAGVPIPLGAHPATGTDRTLVIYQPSTDTLWEMWVAQIEPDGWHARWGGMMTNVSQNPGYFSGPLKTWGATATSLASTGGLISPAELQSGVINHALAMAIPLVRKGWFAAPAQRTDGSDASTDSVPEGAHFRIDPTLDLDSLNLPPITLMLARAAQKYGIIVRDKSATVTFYGEDPTPFGASPYRTLFDNQYPYQFLASFPWSHLQLLQMSLAHN